MSAILRNNCNNSLFTLLLFCKSILLIFFYYLLLMFTTTCFILFVIYPSQETQNMTCLHSFAFLDNILIISLQFCSRIILQQYNAAKHWREKIWTRVAGRHHTWRRCHPLQDSGEGKQTRRTLADRQQWIYFWSRASHPIHGPAAFDRQNCAAMQQLARKGIISWQEFSLTAIQLSPDFPSTKRLLHCETMGQRLTSRDCVASPRQPSRGDKCWGSWWTMKLNQWKNI